MKDTFQIIVLAVFIAFGVLGVIFLAAFRGGGGGEGVTAQIEIWGTVDQRSFNQFISQRKDRGEKPFNVTYRQFPPNSFESEFVEALASGEGPDVVIVSEEMILKHAGKLFVIPYETLDERTFKDTFISQGDLFLSRQGAVALPWSVDPLVLYYNRDLLSSAGLSLPPSYWDELPAYVSSLTRRDENFNILQSAIALGSFENVSHAKDIIAAFLLQSGNSIVAPRGGEYVSTLYQTSDQGTASAIRFFTNFSDPSNSLYSWNRSLPSSKDMFLAGDLAFYIGFASELGELRSKNPNLNFDVAELPQLRSASVRRTFGDIRGFAIVKASPNIADSYVVINGLTSQALQEDFRQVFGLPPVRRDLLANLPNDAVGPVFYKSALISTGWLDPDEEGSTVILGDMIRSITSGTESVRDALSTASARLQNLLESI